MSAPNSRSLIIAAYPVAMLLFAATLFDEAPKVWPMHPGDRTWRYGALGIVLNGVVTPLLALGIAFAAAFLARHRAVVRGLAATALALGVALIVALAIFLIDYAALAGDMDPSVASGFRVATWKTVATMIFAIPAVLSFGIGGWRAGAGVPAAPAVNPPTGPTSDLVVGR